MSASAEPVAILADGDAWEPGGLERLLAAFAAQPGAGLVHGDATLTDAAGVQRGRLAGAPGTGTGLVRRVWRGERPVAARSFVVRRDVLEALGAGAATAPHDFVLRAAALAPVHHVGGAPVVRTPAAAGGDDAAHAAALAATLDRH